MLKVLIVEDEDIIRRGLVHTIDWEKMNCSVAGDAANGKVGLECMKQYQPDVVLTDILMPKMNGLEMIEAAKDVCLHSFQVVFLTSYADFEYARKALQLGAMEYLLKPIDENVLAKTMQRVHLKIADGLMHSKQEFVQNEQEECLVDWANYFNDNTLNNSYVIQALYRIRDHYDEKLSIEALAEELDVSASYLSRKFKEATSHTFVELLSKYRIEKSLALLKKGTYRIYEVSDLIGFNDYKNFCVVFKKYMKKSPKEFNR